MSLKLKPTITVKEARKILGLSARELSDAQVSNLIDTLQMLARNHNNNISSKK